MSWHWQRSQRDFGVTGFCTFGSPYSGGGFPELSCIASLKDICPRTGRKQSVEDWFFWLVWVHGPHLRASCTCEECPDLPIVLNQVNQNCSISLVCWGNLYGSCLFECLKGLLLMWREIGGWCFGLCQADAPCHAPCCVTTWLCWVWVSIYI